MLSIFKFFHILGVVIWIGGMSFAYHCLRPAAVKVLEAPARLALWSHTLRRFFNWVWLAIVLLLASGFGLTFLLGGIYAPQYIFWMMGIGIIMMLIFAHVYFAPFKRLKRTVVSQDWKAAGVALNQIRILVATNLILGLIVVAIATLGRGSI
ncbi:MAG: CopD family protein [Burkholderiales bacterium]